MKGTFREKFLGFNETLLIKKTCALILWSMKRFFYLKNLYLLIELKSLFHLIEDDLFSTI